MTQIQEELKKPGSVFAKCCLLSFSLSLGWRLENGWKKWKVSNSWKCRCLDCVKMVQIRSCFWSVFPRIRTEYGEIRHLSVFSPSAGKYGPEKTPYLDTFHAVLHFLLKFNYTGILYVKVCLEDNLLILEKNRLFWKHIFQGIFQIIF